MALPAGKSDVPKERITLKFRGEDAEVVVAKGLESKSRSNKEKLLKAYLPPATTN